MALLSEVDDADASSCIRNLRTATYATAVASTNTMEKSAVTQEVQVNAALHSSGCTVGPICHSGLPVSHQRVSTTTSPATCNASAGRIELAAQVRAPYTADTAM